jgi:AcrR family transcriptional regulator
MTDKQEKILEAALKLFAEDGYDAISTNKVALMAGVSEGLVFRHFKSKEGLLHAIMDMGRNKLLELFENISAKDEPENIIRKVIEIPFTIGNDEYHFWRLMYMVKWRNDNYMDTLFEPVNNMLIEAFRKLKYPYPVAEAMVVKMFIDGIATNILLRTPDHIDKLKESIFRKYGL